MQCFETLGWATKIAFSLKKPTLILKYSVLMALAKTRVNRASYVKKNWQ